MLFMSLPLVNIPPLDPNLYTAQVRVLGGPVRYGSVSYDTGYTNSSTPPGVYEFATWLYVGTTGNLAITTWYGDTITLPNIAAGIWHPIKTVNVLSLGSTVAASQLFWGS